VRRAGLVAVLLAAGCVPQVAPPPAPAAPRPIAVAVPPPPPVTAPTRADFTVEGDLAQGGLARGRAPSTALSVTLEDTRVELAEDGRFVIGFDRDAGAEARLVATLPGGRTVERVLTIAPTAWSTQAVDVAFRPGGVSDEDYAERRGRETAAIAAARERVTNATGWRERFAWPAMGRISGRFGNQRVYRGGVRGSPHSGVDIAVPRGTSVLAPASGVVVLVSPGEFALEGNLLIVDHGHGLTSAFLHLDRITVREGQAVTAGQPIAAVGSTGRATGPHLHWTLRWNGQRLDPQRVAERDADVTRLP